VSRPRWLGGRGRRALAVDRATGVLAGVTIVVVGAAVAVEVVRSAQRRRRAGAPGLDVAGAALETVAVAVEGYEEASIRESAVFMMLTGFGAAFSVARVSTLGIRRGWWPLPNTRVGGRHLHHFVPGIAIAFAAGGIGLATRNPALHPWLALPFGVGAGLTLDEAALLLELEDVYWSDQGLLSVQVSLIAMALLGTLVLWGRLLRRGERRRQARGAAIASLPPPAGAEASERGGWVG
jgi:hypothetical protein